jgi:hypothetical protein
LVFGADSHINSKVIMDQRLPGCRFLGKMARLSFFRRRGRVYSTTDGSTTTCSVFSMLTLSILLVNSVVGVVAAAVPSAPASPAFHASPDDNSDPASIVFNSGVSSPLVDGNLAGFGKDSSPSPSHGNQFSPPSTSSFSKDYKNHVTETPYDPSSLNAPFPADLLHKNSQSSGANFEQDSSGSVKPSDTDSSTTSTINSGLSDDSQADPSELTSKAAPRATSRSTALRNVGFDVPPGHIIACDVNFVCCFPGQLLACCYDESDLCSASAVDWSLSDMIFALRTNFIQPNSCHGYSFVAAGARVIEASDRKYGSSLELNEYWVRVVTVTHKLLKGNCGVNQPRMVSFENLFTNSPCFSPAKIKSFVRWHLMHLVMGYDKLSVVDAFHQLNCSPTSTRGTTTNASPVADSTGSDNGASPSSSPVGSPIENAESYSPSPAEPSNSAIPTSAQAPTPDPTHTSSSPSDLESEGVERDDVDDSGIHNGGGSDSDEGVNSEDESVDDESNEDKQDIFRFMFSKIVGRLWLPSLGRVGVCILAFVAPSWIMIAFSTGSKLMVLTLVLVSSLVSVGELSNCLTDFFLSLAFGCSFPLALAMRPLLGMRVDSKQLLLNSLSLAFRLGIVDLGFFTFFPLSLYIMPQFVVDTFPSDSRVMALILWLGRGFGVLIVQAVTTAESHVWIVFVSLFLLAGTMQSLCRILFRILLLLLVVAVTCPTTVVNAVLVEAINGSGFVTPPEGFSFSVTPLIAVMALLLLHEFIWCFHHKANLMLNCYSLDNAITYPTSAFREWLLIRSNPNGQRIVWAAAPSTAGKSHLSAKLAGDPDMLVFDPDVAWGGDLEMKRKCLSDRVSDEQRYKRIFLPKLRRAVRRFLSGNKKRKNILVLFHSVPDALACSMPTGAFLGVVPATADHAGRVTFSRNSGASGLNAWRKDSVQNARYPQRSWGEVVDLCVNAVGKDIPSPSIRKGGRIYTYAYVKHHPTDTKKVYVKSPGYDDYELADKKDVVWRKGHAYVYDAIVESLNPTLAAAVAKDAALPKTEISSMLASIAEHDPNAAKAFSDSYNSAGGAIGDVKLPPRSIDTGGNISGISSDRAIAAAVRATAKAEKEMKASSGTGSIFVPAEGVDAREITFSNIGKGITDVECSKLIANAFGPILTSRKRGSKFHVLFKTRGSTGQSLADCSKLHSTPGFENVTVRRPERELFGTYLEGEKARSHLPSQ